MAPSAQRQYSLRDMVLAQRAAFTAGIAYQHAGIGYIHSLPCDACEKIIVTRYPLPKVTRPRVVKNGGIEYRLIGDRLEIRNDSTLGWEPSVTDEQRVRLLRDLIASPTEEVDAEE